VAVPRASGGMRSAPSCVGIWGHPGQRAGTRVGEGQMGDRGAAGRYISSGGEAKKERGVGVGGGGRGSSHGFCSQ